MRGSQTTITVRLVKARPQDLKIKAIDHEIKTLTTKCWLIKKKGILTATYITLDIDRNVPAHL